MTTTISFGESNLANNGLQVGFNSENINFNNYLGERYEPESFVEPFSNVPFLHDPDFIERGVLLDDIHQKCSTPNSRLAVGGLGGIGKSQLIVEYSYRIREKEPDRFVLWVHASNVVRFEQSYQQIADRVNIGEDLESSSDMMKSVLKWLQDPRHKWTFVLDSVGDDSFFDECRYSNGPESPMLPVRAFIPINTNGSIIMTTRSKAVADGFVNDKFHIDVGPMSGDDAQALLGAKLGDHITADDKELVPTLEGLWKLLTSFRSLLYMLRLTSRNDRPFYH